MEINGPYIYCFKSMISINEMPFITSTFGMLLALS